MVHYVSIPAYDVYEVTLVNKQFLNDSKLFIS